MVHRRIAKTTRLTAMAWIAATLASCGTPSTTVKGSPVPEAACQLRAPTVSETSLSTIEMKQNFGPKFFPALIVKLASLDATDGVIRKFSSAIVPTATAVYVARDLPGVVVYAEKKLPLAELCAVAQQMRDLGGVEILVVQEGLPDSKGLEFLKAT